MSLNDKRWEQRKWRWPYQKPRKPQTFREILDDTIAEFLNSGRATNDEIYCALERAKHALD